MVNLVTARHAGPVAGKRAQILPSTIVLGSWCEGLVLIYFGLGFPKNFVPEILQFVQMHLGSTV